METVDAYISLLEKAFIVFRLKGFSRNLRKEISKRDKIYFWDLGIRNIIIHNFFPSEFTHRCQRNVGKFHHWQNASSICPTTKYTLPHIFGEYIPVLKLSI